MFTGRGGSPKKLVRSVVAMLGVCTGLFLACSSTTNNFLDGGGGSAGKAAAGGSSGTSGAVGSSAGMTAQAGKSGASDPGGAGGEGGECAPGATQSCYESPEGKSFGPVPTKAIGSCKIGVSTCTSNAKWSACLGAVPPQSGDSCEPGNDANCNDTPNEGCSCANGETRDCGTDVGECKKGKQTCSAAAWGPCLGEVKAATADTCEEANDANCNGSPNNGCECINGTKQACGSAIGNCKKGEQTCTNGVWGNCAGAVTAQASDKCAPAGDDANCNGVANENCDCTAGASRPCAKCGTQMCGADGKWPSTCSGSKECEPGDVKTSSAACGNCGTQSTKQTCSNACMYGAVTNVGSCLGSGPCQPGVTTDQTQNIGCGNCGTQKQTRACTAACDWPGTWTNAGACTGMCKAAQSCEAGVCKPAQACSNLYFGTARYGNRPLPALYMNDAIVMASYDIKAATPVGGQVRVSNHGTDDSPSTHLELYWTDSALDFAALPTQLILATDTVVPGSAIGAASDEELVTNWIYAFPTPGKHYLLARLSNNSPPANACLQQGYNSSSPAADPQSALHEINIAAQ